jgi:sugar/nucleoside kinase (ribokinase family)
VEVPALPIVVVDTTGAGDTFDGGFLAGWLRGESLQRCAQLGAACGSSTATQVGGFNGQPTWSEALSLLR